MVNSPEGVTYATLYQPFSTTVVTVSSPLRENFISGVVRSVETGIDHAGLGTKLDQYQHMVNCAIPTVNHVLESLRSFIPSSKSDANESCQSQPLSTALSTTSSIWKSPNNESSNPQSSILNANQQVPFLYGHNPPQIITDLIEVVNKYKESSDTAQAVLEYISNIMPEHIWSDNLSDNQPLTNYVNTFLDYANIYLP